MSDFITFPTINLNGNDKDKLQSQYQDALDKLRAAREAIGNIDLHGRDYPKRIDFDDMATIHDFPKARKEFIAHLVKPIQEAESYLEKITIHISQQ